MIYIKDTSFKTLYFTFILMMSVTTITNAQQSIDLFEIRGRHSLQESFQEGNNTEAEKGLYVNLKAPIELSEGLMWYSNIIYTYYQLDFQFSNLELTPIDIQALYFQSGIIKQLNEKFAIQVFAFPRLSGDYNNINSDHFQMGGIALLEKKVNDRLTTRIGALYNNDLLGPFLLPLYYVNYEINDKWNLNLFFPIRGRLSRKFNKDASGGIAYNGVIATYALSGDMANNYIQRTGTDAFLFYRRRLAGNFFAEINAGYILGRDYQVFGTNEKVDLQLSLFEFGDDRTQKNISHNNAGFMNFKIVYNLPIPQE